MVFSAHWYKNHGKKTHIFSSTYSETIITRGCSIDIGLPINCNEAIGYASSLDLALYEELLGLSPHLNKGKAKQ